MKIKLVTVVVVLRLNDIVQHIIRYRRKKMPYHLQTNKQWQGRIWGLAQGTPAPPFVVH